MPESGLSKKDRIRLSRDYQRIKQAGKRFRTQNFLVNYQIAEGGRIRLGVIVTGRMKRACDRNRAKRLLREFFRLNRGEIKAGFAQALNHNELGLDLIVIAYPGAEKLKYNEVKQELEAGLKKEAKRIRKG